MALSLPGEVVRSVETLLAARVTGAWPVSGGQVSPTACVETTAGRVFAKWGTGPTADSFGFEAAGLKRLHEAGTLRVPRVLAVEPASSDASSKSETGFLILEWIAPVEMVDAPLFSQCFAEGLAALHRKTFSEDSYGLEYDNYLGSQRQPNLPRTTDWAAFYRDNRLRPQIERARILGLIQPDRERRLERIIERLPDLLKGMPMGSSLIHGDLWSGNFLCATGDEPVLIDPAIYYAPREMEIAYVQLFGGFPPRFMDNYHAIWPLDEGYDRRRPLHQLYPLLIHLNHFGERYGPAVDGVCRFYLGG